jgi:Tfp pilus assembly protein PilO
MKQNTKRLYSMMIALAFLVVALIVYFDMLTPAYTDLQAAKGNEISEQALLDNEKQVVTQIQTLLATYQTQSGDQQEINAALPVGPNLAGALAQLYGIGSADNIAIQGVGISTQLTTAAALTEGGVAGAAATGQITKPVGSITFTLTVAGSYESIKSFISDLETNMRFFDVGQVSLQPVSSGSSKSGGTDLFTASLSVVTYYQSS